LGVTSSALSDVNYISPPALTIDRNLEGVGNFLIARAFSEHGQNDVIESGLGGRRVWTL
jgi:hypothetical protein